MRSTPAWPAALAAAAILAAGCGQLVEVRPLGSLRLPPPDRTSVVVAADGSALAELHAEQDRELVALDRVPRVLRDAVVAVEDARFWQHGGVDVQAVGRAALENARQAGVAQGGSTITQQLAKNALVGPERTLRRKLEEASVALQLEAAYSKAQILERYLNTVYFGHGAYGVQTAARRYFAADVGELDLAQSALLAGLLRAPAHYDPYVRPDGALRRRNLVLHLMAEQGLAMADEVAAAQATPLRLAPYLPERRWRAPWFVDHVLDVVQRDPAFAALGPDPRARADLLFRGGLRIETTLDPTWQDAAERAVADTLPDPADPRAALAAVDPTTGSIRALVGGRDYYDPNDPHARFNLATDGRRQPGSTFKQLVLAVALARGHQLDERYPGGASVVLAGRPGHPQPWQVDNYQLRDFGALTLRDATALSVNVVYARLIEAVGPEAVAQLATAIVGRDIPPVRSLALGTVEVSPLEMAAVQATFAAGGVYRPPTAVLRIIDADGRVLYQRPEPTGERVMDEAAAYLATAALAGVVDRGTGQRAHLRRPMAGKTGTSEDSADAWFVGYTPDLAAAVWIGFPQARVPMAPPATRIRVEGGNWPAELFARFGLRALADVPARAFPVPAVALRTVRVDVTRNCLPNPHTPPQLVAERAYLAGTEPTRLCAEPTAPPTTDVPGAVGLPLQAALRLLQTAGFAVEQRRQFSVQLPPGYVVRQAPE
ncbi:MAG: transglycosylase domain-containing protein, partial [Actinomycetota bacterium]|nr:transglycosylase domain-containing protein [Actinomycetota bacterium]